MHWPRIVAVAFGVVVVVVAGDLSASKTKECGQLTCEYHQYCSIIDYGCRPCSKICDRGVNQDVKLCNANCQDYIHDERYIERSEYADSKEQIERLRVLATISLIFSVVAFVFLVLAVVLLKLTNKGKRNVFSINPQAKKKKKAAAAAVAASDKPDVTRRDDVLQMTATEISTIRLPNDSVLDMNDIADMIDGKSVPPRMDFTFKNHHAKSEPDSASSVYTNKTNKTSQPLAKRLPSEDSTLDFIYDNPALAPSPVLDKDSSSAGDDGRKVSDGDT